MVTDAKRRIVELLQRLEAATAMHVADELGLTSSAVRQHLDALADLGLVASEPASRTGTRGRPATQWVLTPLARSLFPDRHADLTVELLELVRTEFGEDALNRLIDARTARQQSTYVSSVRRGRGLRARSERLAGIRTAEGYAAEVVDAPDGDGLLLIEHHCPVCEAATACRGLCRGELATFRAVLPDADVVREQHLLAGDARCTYRIRRRRAAG